MANTTMVTTICGESMNDALCNQLAQFYRRFLEEHKRVLQENAYPLRVTLFGQPHDTIIAVDKMRVIIIASKGTSTDSSSTDRYFDFSQRTVLPRELMRSAAQDLGWERMVPLQFSRELVDLPEDLQRKEFRHLSLGMVNQIQERQKMANALGITEALTYLENARARFDAGGPSGFSDCKANSRNAILSLMRGLAGTEKIRDAVKKLQQEGLLGEREAEVVQAIEELVAKLHGLASKTGTHPPLATEEDAFFTLRLTEAVVDYLVRVVAKAKGL